MAANLKVRKDLLDSSVDFDFHGMSCHVDLAVATQEQLANLKELGVDIFEAKEPAEKSDKAK